MHITRRRAAAGVVGLVAVLAIIWTPSLIARTYTSPAQPIDFLARPDKGWRFLVDSVRIARRSTLGTEGQALGRARQRWRGTEGVELVYLTGPVLVPVAEGAVALPDRTRLVRPRSRLTWFVRGRIGRGPTQVIGLIDSVSGRVIWDLRRVVPGAAR